MKLRRTLGRRRGIALGAVAVLVFGWIGPSAPPAYAAAPQVKLVAVAALSGSVVMAVNPANGASYVATRRGLVYMLRPGKSSKLVLDIRSQVRVHHEQGLQGMAFHPTLPYVYLTFNSVAIHGPMWLVEYKVRTDGTFVRSSARIVLQQSKPDTNHNGGNIAFGADGYMYWGFGDGGGAGDPKRNAQNLGTLLGKMIRIAPRPSGNDPYGVPADNPFVGIQGARPEIWAVGFRNPWRWSFDSATGDLWIGDVGQDHLEEIDLSKASDGAGKGLDYGWSAYEGTSRYNQDQPDAAYQAPLYEYDHGVQDSNGCAVIGGYVYHGAAMPALDGAYIFSDVCLGRLYALTLDGQDQPTVRQIGKAPGPVSFGVDAAGELYVIVLGAVYRLAPKP